MKNGLMEYAGFLVEISKNLKSNPSPKRGGGILMTALNNFSSSTLYVIGNIPVNKSENKKLKYFNFAQEKAHRLYSNWLRDQEFFSSWQDKDDDNEKYGGAILLKNNLFCNIISFSGLAQLTDEAVSLMIGKGLGYGSEDEIKKIADFSENEVFYEMLDEIKSRVM